MLHLYRSDLMLTGEFIKALVAVRKQERTGNSGQIVFNQIFFGAFAHINTGRADTGSFKINLRDL
jgi:hypothetical protein